MSTDLTVALERRTKAKRDSEADVALISVWLAVYLLAIIGTLSAPLLSNGLEFAALY